MANEKITKAMVLDMILEKCADDETIVAYCENEKALLASKAEKAKARQAEKRAAGDQLRDAVETILKNAEGPLTRDMILDSFDPEDIEANELTVAKVGNRASELVKFGLAHKVDIKTEGGKVKVGYVIGPATDAE